MILNPKSQTVTFQTLTEQWLSTKKAKIKISTHEKYLSVYCKHIDPAIGSMKAEKITSGIVNNLLLDLCEKTEISGSLFNVIRYLMSAILKYGKQEGYFANVEITVEPARLHKNTVQILTDTQIKTIVKEVENSCTPTSLGIIISLYTGMRLGEVCALKRENVDFDNGVIHVHQTVQRLSDQRGKSALTIGEPKSKSSFREIPMIPHLLKTLKKYGVKELSIEKYVLNGREAPYEPRTLQYGFSRFIRQCEFQELHYHCLRHTFATKCIRAGMDMKTLSEILGHANAGITMNIYVHSDMEQKKRQMKLFEQNLSENIS